MLPSSDCGKLFKRVFETDFHLKKHENTNLPVKLYSGDPFTDFPEFEEYEQQTMTMCDFIAMNSCVHQIKLRLPCTQLHIATEIDSILRNAEEAFAFPYERTHNSRNFRISTMNWRFPEHTDPGNQLVFHLHGEKQWRWKNPDGTHFSCVAEEGDVVFLPIGVPHSTNNLSEVCVIANIAWCYPHDDYETHNKASIMKYPIRAANVKNRCDWYRR